VIEIRGRLSATSFGSSSMFEKINRRSLRSFFGFCALAGFLAKAAAPLWFLYI